MKKTLFALLLLLTSLGSWAYDFKIKGIYYKKTSANTVAVVFKGGDPSDYPDRYSGNVVIPGKVKAGGNSYRVIEIGDGAFKDCSALTSVTIPESVTTICDKAFSGCIGLTSITIPKSVIIIGYQAFSGCSGLTSVTIPKGVTMIGYQMFSGCSALTSVTIPERVIEIGDEAFSGCSGLTSVTIPGSVTEIGDGTFKDCSTLASVSISKNVQWIGCHAFSGCSALTSVTIPESVVEIGDEAFSGCSALTSVAIPERVQWIGDDVFSGCNALTSVKGFQLPSVEESNDDYNRIFDVPEESAEFPGEVYAWLSRNIKYPPICQENGIQGRVSVQFVINKDGSVVGVKVTRSPDQHLSAEAKRVVRTMPKWKPARQGGKPVRMRYVLPIMFRLS